jgi:hypothetical protein
MHASCISNEVVWAATMATGHHDDSCCEAKLSSGRGAQLPALAGLPNCHNARSRNTLAAAAEAVVPVTALVTMPGPFLLV